MDIIIIGTTASITTTVPLITVAELKAFAEIKDSHSDPFLNLLVTAMSPRIETHLNRHLGYSEYTEYLEAGRSRTRYYLPTYPVDLDKTFTVTDCGQELIKDSDYFVRDDAGLLTFYTPPVYVEPKQLKVIWSGGYKEINDSSIYNGSLDVPQDIKLAMYLQCSYMYKRRNDLGLTSIAISGGFTIGKMPAMALLPDVKDMLRNHRRIPGAY